MKNQDNIIHTDYLFKPCFCLKTKSSIKKYILESGSGSSKCRHLNLCKNSDKRDGFYNIEELEDWKQLEDDLNEIGYPYKNTYS